MTPLLIRLSSLVLENIGNGEPPEFLTTPDPSPECAKEVGGNGGQLQCCRVTVAGDLPIVVFLADVIGYNLNPNDINGVICKPPSPPFFNFFPAGFRGLLMLIVWK